MSDAASSPSGAPHVVVVGAGLSGMIAAYRLQQAGLRATVLERAARPGGRFSVEVLEGLVYHPSYPVLPGPAPTLIGVLRELGCAERVTRHQLREFYLRTRRGLRRVRTRPNHWRGLRKTWRRNRLRRIHSDFDGLLRQGRPELATRLDDRSIVQFLRLYLGRRPAALNSALFETAFGLEGAETSRLLLMRHLDGWCEFAPAELFGLGSFVRALPEQLSDLRTDSAVRSIQADGRGVVLASGESLACDATVIATRADSALELLPDPTPAEELALKGVQYRKRLNVVAAVKQEHAMRTILTSPSVESPLAGATDVTPENSPAGNRLRLLMLIARPEFARALWQDSDVNLCNTLLNRIASPRSPLRKSVQSLAVHRLEAESPSYDVGHFRAIARLTKSVRSRFQHRRVLLAGDYLVSPDLEGCALTATRAADALTLALGKQQL